MPSRAISSRAKRAAATLRKPPPAAAAALLRRMQQGKDVRTDKVQRLRMVIRTGAYENDLKLSVAVDRLLRELE